MDTYDYLFKVILVGESSVGKSSILFRYTDKTFSPSFQATIGVDFRITTLSLHEKILKLQLWDTAGQDRYRNIVSSYYRGASGIVLVYDITNKDSFTKLDYWLNECSHIQFGCPKLLIGNKSDLNESRQVSKDEGRELAERLGMGFLETSAKEDLGIDEAFEGLARDMLKDKMIQGKEAKGKVIGRGDVVKGRSWCCV